MDVTHDIRELLLAYRSGHITAAEMNVQLGRTTIRLAQKKLRSRGLGGEDEAARVATIVSHLATKQAGAFGYGEPALIGTVVLGLVEQLVVDHKAHHEASLAALRDILHLLCAGCARTFALFVRETVELLLQATRVSPAVGVACSPLTGLHEFARACTPPTGEPLSPVALHVRQPSQLTWLCSGLLQLCASLHASAPQFVGDGGPILWTALLEQLEAGALPALPAPLQLAPLRALRSLLEAHDAPDGLRARLLHRLLLLLCCGAPAQLPSHDAVCDSVVAPQFRTPECDDLVGHCLERLGRAGHRPPSPSLALLHVAVPWALAVSRSPQLHRSLCHLLRELPPEALASQLPALEPYLARRKLQPALLPCFELALRAHAPGSPASVRAGMCAAADAEDAASRAKRARRAAPSAEAVSVAEQLRLRLTERAMGLSCRLGQSVACADDVGALSMLGAITCLLARGCATAFGASARETTAAEGRSELGRALPASSARFADLVSQLLRKAVEWLDSVERFASHSLDAATSRDAADADSSEREQGGGESILQTALSVARGLLLDTRKIAFQEGLLLTKQLSMAVVRLACLPWSPPPEQAADPHAWAARFEPALRVESLALLVLLPPDVAPAIRATAFHAAIAGSLTPARGKEIEFAVLEGDRHRPPTLEEMAQGRAVERRVGARALELLPQLARKLGPTQSAGDAFHGLAQRLLASDLALVDGQSGKRDAGPEGVAELCTALGTAVGQLACVHAGQCIAGRASTGGGENALGGGCAGTVRCRTCDVDRAPAGAANGGSREGDVGCEDSDGATSGDRGRIDAEGSGRLYQLLPNLWELQLRLAPHEWRGRASLVDGIARLATHATPTQLARSRDVLVELMALLADEQLEVRDACAEVLPRLLGRRTVVRAVLEVGPQSTLHGSTLCQQMLKPMIEATRLRKTEDDREVMLTMLHALGRLGCEPLYADDECRVAVVLALCEHLDAADEHGREYDLAMQLLRNLALATADTNGSIAAMCRRLAPLIGREWVWWIVERPALLVHVAEKLLDADEPALLEMILPHALPPLVLLGGLATQGSPDTRGLIASDVMRTLAEKLGQSAKQLLIDHMHLVLAEVFTSQASDDSEDADVAIPGSLEFMHTHGVARKEQLPAMIRMNCRELMQEMVLRLGRAADDAESANVLMALNLLIPAGLHATFDDDCSNQQVSMMNSVDVNGSNGLLRVYIDANSLMLIQFLRNKISSRSAPRSDKAVALSVRGRRRRWMSVSLSPFPPASALR